MPKIKKKLNINNYFWINLIMALQNLNIVFKMKSVHINQ